MRRDVILSVVITGFVGHASAQTLDQALAAAYVNNPTLNSQRATTRAKDEYVPIALSSYRPKITGSS
jgi:outer membrane protein